MDTRRSFYLAPRQDDFVEPVSDTNWVDSTDVPYVTPANDNLRDMRETLASSPGHSDRVPA
jgi:hypothetical protein